MTGFIHPSGWAPNPKSIITPSSAPTPIKEMALSPSSLTLLLDPSVSSHFSLLFSFMHCIAHSTSIGFEKFYLGLDCFGFAKLTTSLGFESSLLFF